MRYFLMLLSLLFTGALFAQKEITIAEIWKDRIFSTRTVPGFNFQNDGKHYTRLEGNQIKQYDLTTGKYTKTIFDARNKMVVEYNKGAVPDGKGMIQKTEVSLNIDGFDLREDVSKIIVHTNKERIYRRSSKGHAYVYDLQTQELMNIAPGGKQRYTRLSPQGDQVAYVRDNNLFIRKLSEAKEKQVTQDGKYNEIINGSADWVYEEEFSMARAFEWSPDGTKIAFWRFDESAVKEFTMLKYKDALYPEHVTFKYPKVGATNSTVSIHIYHLETGKTVKAQTGKAEYFPRIAWSKDSKKLVIFKMNRHQNELELLATDAKTGNVKTILKETSKYYIEIHDNLTLLKDGNHFLWTSEKDGYNHIYLYDMAGNLKTQLTKGKYDVTSFYGYDEKHKQVFYQAAEKSPLDREVYSVGIDGKNKKAIAAAPGTNRAQFSKTFDYYIIDHSTANEPSTYTVYNREGEVVRLIEENRGIRNFQKEYNAQTVEFFNFKTSENVKLNGYMIKPPQFNARKQYPVLMFVYGGPSSQTVLNSFKNRNYWWFQLLAQKGYVVVSVDNRGTGARGEEFRKMTYLQLGKYETIDQIEAAKYLANLPYIDKNRIGIFGWSYGGYMSSLCLFKGADVFKSAIAVAPVTNWKWYDSIYTERYMRTEKENPDGYKNNSPVYFANLLKGNYLLVHGLGDDNVHPQHSIEMINALVEADKQFDTMLYTNKNHGLSGGNARHHLYTKMTKFILEKL